jgi:type VI secretion system ImpC/EvpB family protein
LVSDLVRPHLISVDENEQSALLAAIDAVIADLMRRILHDRRFQALEAAWRGLYLLVRRAETGLDLKISILDIQKDELLNNLKSHNNLEDSSLFRFLVKNIPVGFGGSEPWSAVIGDYAFLPNVEDVAGLVRIAKIASDARAPFISHIRPDVLGITSLADDPDPTYWNGDDMSNERKLWEALRGIPEAKYLAMTMPRMLGRLPYGRETDPLETFSFEEFEGMPSHNDYLWANGCYAAGLLLARTFSANGWEMNRGFCLDVERLPMHVYESNGETVVQPCSEVILSERACEVLIDSGILPLIAFKNSDHLKLAGFRSIAAHGSALAGRWT